MANKEHKQAGSCLIAERGLGKPSSRPTLPPLSRNKSNYRLSKGSCEYKEDRVWKGLAEFLQSRWDSWILPKKTLPRANTEQHCLLEVRKNYKTFLIKVVFNKSMYFNVVT